MINEEKNALKEWIGFRGEVWKNEINVESFIKENYTEYLGDDSFLKDATQNTITLWNMVSELMKDEIKNGLSVEEKTISSITAYGSGYINKDLEKIVGLQTTKPLERAIMPYGGIRMVESAMKDQGKVISPEIKEIFIKHRKTHNEAVFDVYTEDIRKARKVGIITGLPDAYGRGRIIGDYRRVPLYGIDRLIEEKEVDKKSKSLKIDEISIKEIEEISEQIKALKELKEMAFMYDIDISRPANCFKDAVQWLYFAYLAAVKEQNGAAMSLGRTSTFLDIYAERDLSKGIITEDEVQEIIDHFIMKLRMIRFLRTSDYNSLFSGDPTWITESIGGMNIENNKSFVTKNSFRYLHTLYNLGPAPEPNMTVLWSNHLPENFKIFCSKLSIDTSAIQYENDDLMKSYFGDDYGIACCVSPMKIGKQMQFFGARANLAKALLYAINEGIDEKTGIKVIDNIPPLKEDPLNYNEAWKNLDLVLDWISKTYIDALNIIHFMHDKYDYERIEMALHDSDVIRTMACGIAGLSVLADSLSAIKHARVFPIRNEEGVAIDFDINGDFPCYGNNDDRVDQIVVDIVKVFMKKLENKSTYRDSYVTQSILTITSNVVYGKKTGATPDGRKAGVPFAPGANPMHGRDKTGVLNSCVSVAKIPFEYAQDGISYTFSVLPQTLGNNNIDRVKNLVGILDGYFFAGGQHMNVNVHDKKILIDAIDHPENYPQLTIRVSGYAVNFIKLTKEQQLDIINRTFH